MTTDTPLDGARAAGRRLGLDLMRNIEPTGPSTSLRRATVVRVNLAAGEYTADLTVAGTTLHAIPLTTECLACKPGDRVLVETYGTQSFVTGVLARTGSVTPPFAWSSTWSGIPSGEPSTGYVEKTQSVALGGLVICEVAAAVSGTGEYGMAFDFLDSDGKRAAYWCSTSPQKNGGVLRWTAVGTVLLAPGTYTVKLTTYHWGTVSIAGADSSGNSLKWRDSQWGTDGVPRYARLRMA